MTSARVLVVEDERIIALTLRRMLEDRGYTVVGTATSALSAVCKAQADSPDIVLMDVHLDGPTDGITAARQIEAEMGLPIVFLTAYSEDETIQRASQCNAYSYLVKPVQAAELHATIQLAIAKHALDRRLRLALDVSAIAVWEWSVTTGKLESTSDLSNLVGAGQADSGSLYSYFPDILPEDQPAFKEFLDRAENDPTPNDLVFRCRRHDATIRWIESYARAYREPHSGRTRTIGTLRDVTSQRESEARLRLAAALFENLVDAVAVTTPELRITTVNPAFIRITGVRLPEAEDREISSFVDIPSIRATPWQGESLCRHRDGQCFPIWLTLTPVVNGDTLTALVYSFSDISPLRKAQADLDFLAHHDSLTGLPNRLHFQEHIDGLIARSVPFSLIYIDLDHFKLINDSRGHNSGDIVLQELAIRIRTIIRGIGFAARLGGDEFVIVVPTCTPEFASALVVTISQPIPVNGESLITTASVGSSDFPTDGTNREALILAADTAMYVAKREGPNSYRPYSPALYGSQSERYEIEQGIRRAFASSDLQILYQPIISLVDGRMAGAEALVRWRHPEKGLLNPDRFVPIVEDVGLIEQLGESVLRMACRDWTSWQEAGIHAPRLSINVSARQISSGAFPALLYSVLKEFSVPPSIIDIEITESSLQSVQKSQRFISDLKAIGVHVAIDDFGTGYSHLASLRDLPVDRIKLDRAFLPASQPQQSDIALFGAIVAIARAKNLQITAEGVETSVQCEFVRRAGCDEAQGFWFSYPISFAELMALYGQGSFVLKN